MDYAFKYKKQGVLYNNLHEMEIAGKAPINVRANMAAIIDDVKRFTCSCGNRITVIINDEDANVILIQPCCNG
jgi:hypothetical protein